MRNLQTKDIFSGCRLLTEIGIKDEIKNLVLKKKELNVNLNDEEIGFEIIFTLFDRAIQARAEQKIYEFLSGLFECTPEEVAEMDPVEWIEGLKQIAEPKKWKDFFGHVVSLIHMN